MGSHRESTFVCLCICLASTVVQPACGRDGLLAAGAAGGGGENPGGTKVRRAFLLPNNLTAQWAAYQDGSGPWTPIEPLEPNGQDYELTLNDPSRQFGFVIAAAPTTEYVEAAVSFLTVDDCLRGMDLGTSRPRVERTQDANVSWRLTGLASDDYALVSLAGRSFEGMYTNASAHWPSSGDLLATAGPVKGLPTRMIIRRNLKIVDGMTLPTIDFSSAEAFDLRADRLTLTNAPATGESYAGVNLTTAGGRILMSPWGTTPGTTVPFVSAPAARLMKGDLYEATYMYLSTAGGITVTSYFVSPSGQALTVPSLPSGATVRNSGGPGDVRLTVEWPVSEPGSLRYAYYSQGPDMSHLKWWLVTVSPSYPAGAVTVPDLRDVAGWDTNWDLSPGRPTHWTVGSEVSSNPDFRPQDGTVKISASQDGTIVP